MKRWLELGTVLMLCSACVGSISVTNAPDGLAQSTRSVQSEVTMEPEMEQQEECPFVRLLPDGSPVVRLRGIEQSVKIYGIEIPQPPTESYIDLMTQRLPALSKPLRCIVRGSEPTGQLRVQLFYYGWQDKSGDVWLDLAVSLLDQGVARVSALEFPERDEYLQREQESH
ncbi:MAG TPA: hypothetical protein V6D33_18670 [Cyanophyceae cyanobacterium]